MNSHTEIASTSTLLCLDGRVYYVTPTGWVFLELGARQGAPYVRRCSAAMTARALAAGKWQGGAL